MNDYRIKEIIEALKQLQQGNLAASLSVQGDDDIAALARSVVELRKDLAVRFAEDETLFKITEKINAGLVLDEILNYAYDALKAIIPFERIGFSLLEEDGEILRAVWAKSETAETKLLNGYAAKMEGSSLQQILLTGQPRIINDLVGYLKDHPQSDSTRRIVTEGMRSSLTCPLLAKGKPIGFIFFSSQKPSTYEHAHVSLFLRIANQLSIIAEKSRLYQRLLELNDLKNKFLGIAAHDLRSPLTVIKGNLELLRDNLLGELTGVQRESILKMIDYCDNMLILINDFLDVSAIESGIIELHRQEVDARDFLEKCVAFNKLLAQAKAIDLKTSFPEDLPRMSIDPDRMAQVMNNLISNAIKFSYPQTSISISAQTVDGQLEVAVTDQGQGIPQQELPKLFEFFGKTKVRPTQGERSTGLGLAIVKRMVEAQGGRIAVMSQLNVGSTFKVTLPITQSQSSG
jgi:signal transduction histidine kinase